MGLISYFRMLSDIVVWKTSGERLKKYRRHAELTQAKLAELLGVSQQAVSNWELCNSYPTPKQAYELRKVLCEELCRVRRRRQIPDRIMQARAAINEIDRLLNDPAFLQWAID